MFCPRQKNNPLHFQNQRYIGIFISLRERRRGRERERKRDKKVRAIIFLNCPGQNEKSAYYILYYIIQNHLWQTDTFGKSA
jgi:hypothetical protein